jgi:hypothetical protein
VCVVVCVVAVVMVPLLVEVSAFRVDRPGCRKSSDETGAENRAEDRPSALADSGEAGQNSAGRATLLIGGETANHWWRDGEGPMVSDGT